MKPMKAKGRFVGGPSVKQNKADKKIIGLDRYRRKCAMCRKPNAMHRAKTTHGNHYALCDGCFTLVGKAPIRLLIAIQERVNEESGGGTNGIFH